MDFVKMTDEQKKNVLEMLEPEEKDCLQKAEKILQTIAGVYINNPGNPELSDLYRYAAGTLSDLRNFNE